MHISKRKILIGSGSLLAFCAFAGAVLAAEPAPQQTDKPDDTTVVVVTASRITSRGFKAPTPTTSISTTDIANMAQPNVFTTITQLPSLQGSSGVATNTFSTSS